MRNYLAELDWVVFVLSQVLKKLARRQMMYHSYAMQVHGYVTPSKAMEEGDAPLVLVHGVRAFALFPRADLVLS